MTTQTTADSDLITALQSAIASQELYIEDALADGDIEDSYVDSLRAELASLQYKLATTMGTVGSNLPTTDVVQVKIAQARAAKAAALAQFLAKDAERVRDTTFKSRRNPDYDWATEPNRVDDYKLYMKYKTDLNTANAQLVLLNGVVSARFDAPDNAVFDSVFNAELSSTLFGGAALKELAKLDELVATDPSFASTCQTLTQEGGTGWDALIEFIMLSQNKEVVVDLLQPLFELATMMAQKNYSSSKNEMAKISETPMMAAWKQLKTKWNRVAKHLGIDTSIDVSIDELTLAINSAIASQQGFTFNEKWQTNLGELKKAIGDAWDADYEKYLTVLINANVMTIVGNTAASGITLKDMEDRVRKMSQPMSNTKFMDDPDPACAAAAKEGGMPWQTYIQGYRVQVNALKNNSARTLPSKPRR